MSQLFHCFKKINKCIALAKILLFTYGTFTIHFLYDTVLEKEHKLQNSINTKEITLQKLEKYLKKVSAHMKNMQCQQKTEAGYCGSMAVWHGQ